MNNVKKNLVMLLNKCDFINSGSISCIFLSEQDHNFKYKTLFLMQETTYSVHSQCLGNERARKPLEQLHPLRSPNLSNWQPLTEPRCPHFLFILQLGDCISKDSYPDGNITWYRNGKVLQPLEGGGYEVGSKFRWPILTFSCPGIP